MGQSGEIVEEKHLSSSGVVLSFKEHFMHTSDDFTDKKHLITLKMKLHQAEVTQPPS